VRRLVAHVGEKNALLARGFERLIVQHETGARLRMMRSLTSRTIMMNSQPIERKSLLA